jgi:Uma2 family endonuclease
VTTKPLKKRATYDDLREVPDRFVAEMFDGDLYVSPRPALPHANAASGLLTEIRGSFHRRNPGGWVILVAPELHFGRDVLVPDIAGWRRERLPDVPAEAYLTLAPDWVCEVLSPSTESLDRIKKLRIYAREGVGHAWLVDPFAQTLEVLSLDAGNRKHAGHYEGAAVVRAVPFDAIELDLRKLWT